MPGHPDACAANKDRAEEVEIPVSCGTDDVGIVDQRRINKAVPASFLNVAVTVQLVEKDGVLPVALLAGMHCTVCGKDIV